jgi:tetratricopeptide (TPR) repeat protein
VGRRLLVPCFVLVLFAGCTGTTAPDYTAALRARYAERLAAFPGSDLRAVDLTVPFALDDTVREVLEEELARPYREADRLSEVLDLVLRRFNLSYVSEPTRTAVETFHAREANCLSFVNLVVGIAREHDLDASYVEVEDVRRWSFRQGMVVSRGHVVVGVVVEGRLRLVDFLPDAPPEYRAYRVVDDLRAAAHFYNNLAAEALLAERDAEAVSLAQKAVVLAPELARAHSNLGVALARVGRLDEAAASYARGLARDSEDPVLLGNLAALHQRRGELEEAEALLARLEALREAGPWVQLHRAEQALGRSAPGEALGWLAEALRKDAEIPEVHLGLVRAYLALGELDRARHHLERALRLDPGSVEARRYAELLGVSR